MLTPREFYQERDPEPAAKLGEEVVALRNRLATMQRWVLGIIKALNEPGALTIDEADIRAANGIRFPATQVPQSDANTLDDFANNKSWTPIDASGAGLSFGSAAGRYTKIGDTVLAWGYVVYPVTANGANASIGGFPFTCANEEQARGGGTISYKTESTLATIAINKNTTATALFSESGVNITNATMSGDTIYFLVIYPV